MAPHADAFEFRRAEPPPTKAIQAYTARSTAKSPRPTVPPYSLCFAGASVGDFHGFLFLTAAVFIPLERHVVVVGDLNYFANWCFHSGHHFDFAGISECLGRGIVGAFGKLNAGAHVLDPRAHELLLCVVVSFDTHAFELHILHFAVLARHLHFTRHVHHHVAASHDVLTCSAPFGFLRLGVRIGIHPHFYGKIPIAIHG